jgi:isopenicillin N synthase-like dioxygenase
MTDQLAALNRDFEKYDQVRKAHTYRLAESEADEFDEDYQIATLDFGRFLRGDAKDKARFAEEFAAALREIGFGVLTGHGVDPALYDEVHDGVLDLFTTTSLEDKMRFRAARFGSVSQGYFPIEETSDIHPDLVEGWVWCRRAFDLPQHRDAPFRPENFWPRAEYEPFFRRACQQPGSPSVLHAIATPVARARVER